MIKFTQCFCFIFLLSACKVGPPQKIDKGEVSFICPQGWKITDQLNIGDLVNYLSIEEKGFDASGAITMTWYEDDLTDQNDLDELIEDYKENFKENFILRKSNMTFEETEHNEFNGIDCRRSNYTLSLLKIKHEGVIMAFHKKAKTFIITIQSANSDLPENNDSFSVFEESFRLKERT